MSMVIYPCFARNFVSDPANGIKEMTAIFSKQDERFVENKIVNCSLLSVCSVIGVGTRNPLACFDWLSSGVEELYDVAKWLKLSRTCRHRSKFSNSFRPSEISASSFANRARITSGGSYSTASYSTSL